MLFTAPPGAESLDLDRPCRYCGAPYGYRVLVKRHYEIFCDVCGAYLSTRRITPREPIRCSIPPNELAAWNQAVERLCRALWRSPTLQHYRAIKDLDLEIPTDWEASDVAKD